MNSRSHPGSGENRLARTSLALSGIIVGFLILTSAFFLNLWGETVPVLAHPLVDTNFLDTATVRRSYPELVRAEEDVSGFDCYACHEKTKLSPLTFDENHKLILPKEHEDIVMAHGQHERNNNCYNCHNETNLELFQTRDGRELKLAESTALCGSCHGPTYRDWEAGAHGRMNGFWKKELGPQTRRDCVNCHNPHSPKYPGRKPAPPPHPLRELPAAHGAQSKTH
jgi:uncharacterized CHY-type Zn-finger protein